MNFCPSDIKYHSTLLILILTTCSFQTVVAQIILPKEIQQRAPIIINEYVNQYPNIPALPKIYERWYYTPKQIAQYITFVGINPQIRYFKDNDSPYFELIKDGVKGRLFLKIVGGPLYQILDLYFVPYFDDISKRALNNNEQDKNTPKKDISDANDTPLSTNNDVAQQKDDTKEDDGKNSVVPLFTQRFQGDGATLYLDVISFDKKRRRNTLTRYNPQRLVVFSEGYVYTSKGALQRLVRKYANGATERFIYYFNTGGLKEVFYQNMDGSSYMIRYTEGGDLSYKRIFNKDNTLVYELVNNYLKNTVLAEETDFKKGIHTYSHNVDNKLITKKTYTIVQNTEEESKDDTELSIKDKDSKKEYSNTKSTTVTKNKNQSKIQDKATKIIAGQTFVLLTEESFTYNKQGNEVDTNSLGTLHERSTITEYDADGVVVRVKNFFNNLLNYEIVYSKNNERTQIYYLHDNPVLRVYYAGSAKVKEEILENGKIIETR